jgi:hypothetical protein
MDHNFYDYNATNVAVYYFFNESDGDYECNNIVSIIRYMPCGYKVNRD